MGGWEKHDHIVVFSLFRFVFVLGWLGEWALFYHKREPEREHERKNITHGLFWGGVLELERGGQWKTFLGGFFVFLGVWFAVGRFVCS